MPDPVSVIVTPADSDKFTVIDEHYAQLRSDRDTLSLYRNRSASYRQAAAKLVEAARLLEQESKPLEEKLSRTREFCAASLSDSPGSDRASSVLSTVQQLATDAMPAVRELPEYASGNGHSMNGAVYPRHMGLQYVNGPATPPSPHHNYSAERYHSITPLPAGDPPMRQRPLKRSRSEIEEDGMDELEDDRHTPNSLGSTDGMVFKLPHDSAPPRKQGKFTDDDRHKIAAYLATATSRAQNGGIDWKQFALTNTKYDATGWRTQYHSRKHKIDPLIDNYRRAPVMAQLEPVSHSNRSSPSNNHVPVPTAAPMQPPNHNSHEYVPAPPMQSAPQQAPTPPAPAVSPPSARADSPIMTAFTPN